jgi:hypothetical protein
MNILVAANAGCGGPSKYDLPRHTGAGTMAFAAGDRAVCASQWERRGGVVEGSHIPPGAHGMAYVTIVFRLRC